MEFEKSMFLRRVVHSQSTLPTPNKKKNFALHVLKLSRKILLTGKKTIYMMQISFSFNFKTS
jgi:hypothetical protein